MNNTKRAQDRQIIIKIDGEEIKAPKPAMVGKEIKALGKGPAEYMLILVVGEPDEVAGGDDKIISDDELVDLKDGMRFRIVKPIMIEVNGKPFVAPKPAMVGKEIKALGKGPAEYMLILVVGEPDEVAGGDDKIISDDELVDLKDGMRFRIVNPATFG